MARFTDEQAMEALRDAVACYGPNHIAPASSPDINECRYWDKINDTPECLLGCALIILGVGKAVLVVEDENGTSFGNSPRLSRMFSARIIAAYGEAQWWQDTGHTMGHALRMAEKKYLEFSAD